MPCNGGYSDSDRTQEKLDKATRLLCEIGKQLDALKGDADDADNLYQWLDAHIELKAWWAVHKLEDAERIKEEKEREQAEYKSKKKQFDRLKKELGL